MENNTNNSLIHSIQNKYVCPWFSLEEKQVFLPQKKSLDSYYSLNLPDYVAIFAQNNQGLVPIVRQYRPAIESYTWEFPSGTLENNESPKDCCIREIQEEAGLIPSEIHYLGDFFTDVGRLSNKVHLFYVRSQQSIESFLPETELNLEFISVNQIDTVFKINFIMHLALWKIVKNSGLLIE